MKPHIFHVAEHTIPGGRRNWWVISDGTITVTGRAGESKLTVMGRWVEEYGNPQGMHHFTRVPGYCRLSEAATQIASMRRDAEAAATAGANGTEGGVGGPKPEGGTTVSEVKYTPGPWAVVPPHETQGWGWCVASRGTILLSMRGPKLSREQKEADAALVAAAPDLLECCAAALPLLQLLAAKLDGPAAVEATISRVRAAILKATGERGRE